ncbi:MAG: hypothetical protein K6V73_06310 [Firmicutes bacterium]|nr:hypothetical protein [Bacillota bacterium]
MRANERAGLGIRVYVKALAVRARAEDAVNRVLGRVGGQAGQSEWVSTALKVGIGLAAAGLVYTFVAGPLKTMFSNAGASVTGLNGSVAGGSLP